MFYNILTVIFILIATLCFAYGIYLVCKNSRYNKLKELGYNYLTGGSSLIAILIIIYLMIYAAGDLFLKKSELILNVEILDHVAQIKYLEEEKIFLIPVPGELLLLSGLGPTLDLEKFENIPSIREIYSDKDVKKIESIINSKKLNLKLENNKPFIYLPFKQKNLNLVHLPKPNPPVFPTIFRNPFDAIEDINKLFRYLNNTSLYYELNSIPKLKEETWEEFFTKILQNNRNKEKTKIQIEVVIKREPHFLKTNNLRKPKLVNLYSTKSIKIYSNDSIIK